MIVSVNPFVEEPIEFLTRNCFRQIAEVLSHRVFILKLRIRVVGTHDVEERAVAENPPQHVKDPCSLVVHSQTEDIPDTGRIVDVNPATGEVVAMPMLPVK